MSDFKKVVFSVQSELVADFEPQMPSITPELAAFIEQAHRRVGMDLEMQLYDPMFRDYCKRMAAISGRSYFEIAEAGYGLSNANIFFK